MPAKRQLCSANRQFHRAVEPAAPLGVTQFRTRTQSVRTVLGLVLDASCQSLEYEDEYRCAEYEYEYEKEYEKEYEYEREALGTGNATAEGAKRDKRMQDKRILSLSHSRVPDVFMNRVTRLPDVVMNRVTRLGVSPVCQRSGNFALPIAGFIGLSNLPPHWA
jgi:hypothetical protein